MKRKSNMQLLLFSGIFFLSLITHGQVITGKVMESDNEGKKNPLTGVNIHWLKTTLGTISDANGEFKLSTAAIKDMRLVVSLVGYRTDTLAARGLSHLDITLTQSSSQLNTVEVQGKIGSSFISELDPRKVQNITSHELRRAACCNLAESFETNSSVDVNYADAITGARQIQMLGLSGVYSQIITENVPLVRGLGSSFGMGYIPGSWMESIQLSKGASSVINGFESTTGQINVELKKPATSEKFFLNAYVNQRGRAELNVDAATKINNHLSTMLLGHASHFNNPVDANNDLFMDQPQLTTYNLMNRWDYMVHDRYVSRFGVKFIDENRVGGFLDFNPETYQSDTIGIQDGTKTYGLKVHTQRLESFWKNGIMFKDKPDKSIALIVSGIYHKQDGFFGLNKYNGVQKSFYSNLLYQNIIGNPHHKFTTGMSFMYDNYAEKYERTDFTYLYQVVGGDLDNNPDTLFAIHSYRDTTYKMDRKEIVPGAFLEYTLNIHDKFTLITGIRADHHNTYGIFFTPRVHLRYKVTPTTTLRASIGKGYRTANIFAENYSLMASQRVIHFVDVPKQEEAWNMGVNLTHDFKLFKRDAQIDLEAYRTSFVNQLIVDIDSMPADVFIYNLDGKSYSNILQLQLTLEPLRNLSILAAFRLNDVHVTENGKLREKAMVNAYKGLLTASYITKFGKWKFDVTTQFNGKARIPDTQKMPDLLKRAEYSDAYIQLLAQVTRHFKKVDVYLGGENLTNFTQNDPITEYWKPYHTHFDTSMVWGPIVGATVYAGLRFSIK
jgi:outer membrane receptor for ferrienterochelin and colicins